MNSEEMFIAEKIKNVKEGKSTEKSTDLVVDASSVLSISKAIVMLGKLKEQMIAEQGETAGIIDFLTGLYTNYGLITEIVPLPQGDSFRDRFNRRFTIKSVVASVTKQSVEGYDHLENFGLDIETKQTELYLTEIKSTVFPYLNAYDYLKHVCEGYESMKLAENLNKEIRARFNVEPKILKYPNKKTGFFDRICSFFGIG